MRAGHTRRARILHRRECRACDAGRYNQQGTAPARYGGWQMFDPNAQLDTSQVNDQRGSGGGGGMGRGGGIAIGGGAGTIIVLVLALLFGVNPGSIINSGSNSNAVATAPAGQVGAPGTGNIAQNCRTGTDANNSTDCRVVGTVNSVQK